MIRSEMAECLGCSDSTVKRALQSMVEKGVIKRIGSNKKDEWIILNVNDDDSGKKVIFAIRICNISLGRLLQKPGDCKHFTGCDIACNHKGLWLKKRMKLYFSQKNQ